MMRIGILIVVVALGCAVWASQALAVFPFVGKGTLSEPSSWKLAPGETVTNLGGELTQHFGSVPQAPAGATEPESSVSVHTQA